MQGPFLFRAFTIADAVFAPVVSRFRPYDVSLARVCQDYADAIRAWPAFGMWRKAAENEPMFIDKAGF